MNVILRPSPAPNRYPLNQNSAIVVNMLAASGFYLVTVFFPNVIWLGLALVLFGLLQFVVHGVVTNVKVRSVYNPGLAAVVRSSWGTSQSASTTSTTSTRRGRRASGLGVRCRVPGRPPLPLPREKLGRFTPPYTSADK
jgi:hypothetical protein